MNSNEMFVAMTDAYATWAGTSGSVAIWLFGIVGVLCTWVVSIPVLWEMVDFFIEIMKEFEAEAYMVEESSLPIVLTEHHMVLVNSDANVTPEYYNWFQVSQDWDKWERWGRPIEMIV